MIVIKTRKTNIDVLRGMLWRAYEDPKALRDGLSVSFTDIETIPKERCKKLAKIINHLEPARPWFKSKPTDYFWRASNMIFPLDLYKKHGETIAGLHKSPLFRKRFSYTSRMMNQGKDGNLDLISYFIRRMKTRYASCPFYYFPTFNVDMFHREAVKGGKKISLLRSTTSGSFCMAALQFVINPDKTYRAFITYRNWLASRWVPNMNGIGMMLQAIAKEVKNYKLTRVDITAAIAGSDWKPEIVKSLYDAI